MIESPASIARALMNDLGINGGIEYAERITQSATIAEMSNAYREAAAIIKRESPAMQHPPTWNQFQESIVSDLMSEHDCTRSEAADCATFRRRDWERIVEEYARQGGEFRAGWLNTLERCHRQLLYKYNRPSFPQHYIMPESREHAARRSA